MTEAEWLGATEPAPMLEFLRETASDRKLRLYAVACARRIWHRIDDLGKAAIEVAERFADGRADAEQLRAGRLACKSADGNAAWYPAASRAFIAAGNTVRSVQSGTAPGPALAAERAAQAAILRDIIGNPFHPCPLSSSWLLPEVIEIARSIYDARAFDRLPVLAFALEKAGCSDAEILQHCRQAHAHVPGCWVIDVILGLAPKAIATDETRAEHG